jgi:hypothetical protein
MIHKKLILLGGVVYLYYEPGSGTGGGMIGRCDIGENYEKCR